MFIYFLRQRTCTIKSTGERHEKRRSKVNHQWFFAEAETVQVHISFVITQEDDTTKVFYARCPLNITEHHLYDHYKCVCHTMSLFSTDHALLLRQHATGARVVARETIRLFSLD